MTGTWLSPAEALRVLHPTSSGFRDCQEEALARIWSRRSSLVLMPTGAGKSIVYQLPVFASRGIGVVISPLIALMQQQAEFLTQRGARVLSLGGLEPLQAHEKLRTMDWSSGTTFLFVSPERLETDGYLEYVLRRHAARIALVAVDEAHCISQWGDEFRPPYKAIPGFIDRVFGSSAWPSVVCMTATLDAHSADEILIDFRLSAEDVVRSRNMLRTNLALTFQVFDDSDAKMQALRGLLGEFRGEKVIVYAHLKHHRTRGTRAMAEVFSVAGYPCAPFDADLSSEEKLATLQQFVTGDTQVVFATGAFGLGVDIPDVRCVIHFLLPELLEQYYQEVGRAGRDGNPARGILLYTPINAKVRHDMIAAGAYRADQVRELWRQLECSGRRRLRTVYPWLEFQGKEEAYAQFYAFQRVGALNVVARGPAALNSYRPHGDEGKAFLDRLASGTVTGNLAAAIHRLSLDATGTIDALYALYDRGQIRLERSPSNTLLYETRGLTDADVTCIVDDRTEKIQKRLAGLDAFVDVVESGVDPTTVLRERFGAPRAVADVR